MQQSKRRVVPGISELTSDYAGVHTILRSDAYPRQVDAISYLPIIHRKIGSFFSVYKYHVNMLLCCERGECFHTI
jgi:hypothetical protein